MRKIVLVLCLSLCYSSTIWANNGLGSLADQLNSITKTASIETSKQMAIRVNLSGRQRMLTQKMSKESLLIALKVDTEKNKKNLESTVKLFDTVLKGLQEGDESLGLTETSNKDILTQLGNVVKLWVEFKPYVEAVYEGNDDSATLDNIASKNLALLAEMNKVVSLYEQNSGADLSDLAMVINLSGRQRMLTQKMTKELLLKAKSINVAENEENLTKTVVLFDKTLKGLINGDEELGLSKTSDDKIVAQLEAVDTLWNGFKPVVEKADVEMESLKKVAELNLPLLVAMDKAVKMYEVQSK